METTHWIAFELALLAICEFGPLSPFLARKLCHAGSGLMMLQLDPEDWLARWFVYSVALVSLMMVWEVGVPFQFRYSKRKDVGMTVYLVIVTVFFYLKMPLSIIRPVFLADPMGAIIGKSLTQNNIYNPKWVGDKTVGGTIAVMITAFLSLTFGNVWHKLLLSILIAFVEGISLEIDNLLIAGVVIIAYNIVG